MDERPLVIVGDGEFAEIAYEYFTVDSPYRVAAFAVERPYLKRDRLNDLPVVALEDIEREFPPTEHDAFVAITFTQLNRLRARLYRVTKEKGYRLASFISPHAFVWRNATIGENCFIFEQNVVQHHARIGDNVILWSGNHLGHRAVIGSHCFVSSHVVISGYCEIGESCFLGVNSTIADNLRIGESCVIGAGAVLTSHAQANRVYRGNPAKAADVEATRLFKVRGAA